jgi:hypothetical protein
VSDVQIFLEREHPERARTVEVVCSSARRDMDQHAVHTPFRLFSHTIKLEDEPISRWPETTDIWCWHCCHPFDTMPLCIPKSKLMHHATNVYYVYGVFCSCNCAVKYILERTTYDQQQILLAFKEMVSKVFHLQGVNTNVFALEPAPPRIFLRVFGGHLGIEEFRNTSLTARTTLITPPFVSYSMVLEESARKAPSTETAVDGTVNPITSHTIRGLRRPTVPCEMTAVDNTVERTDDGEKAAPCAFDAFMERRDKETADTGNSTAEAQGTAIESSTKPRRSTRRTYKRASNTANTAAMSNNGGAGTLAAFLRPQEAEQH